MNLWDPHTGTRQKIGAKVLNGTTSFKLSLGPVKSAFAVNETGEILHDFKDE